MGQRPSGAGCCAWRLWSKSTTSILLVHTFPDLLARYQRAYPRSDAPREYLDRLDERIVRVKERYGFAADNAEVRTPEAAVASAASSVSGSRPGQLAFALPGL